MAWRHVCRVSALLSCLLAASIQTVNAGSSSGGGKQSGLVMDVSSEYFGPSIIHVSKDGIRINSKKLGIVIVSHAPSWSVVAFNERSKSYYEATFDEWKKRVAARSGMKHGKQEIVQTGMTKICGQKAKIYRWTDWYSRGGRKKINPLVTDLYAMQSVLVPKQAAAVIASASDLPADFGLPMRIARSQKGMKSATVLDTLKCKETAIEKTMFVQPKGFKRVTSEVALIMESGDDEMGDLMDGLNAK